MRDPAEAIRLDEEDPLAPLRERFYIPTGQIYLDGNSLGLLSKDAEASLKLGLEAWKTCGIGGWLDGKNPWFTMAEDLSRRVAFLVGAGKEQVAVTGSTTGNLHQLVATLNRSRKFRGKILIEEGAFPSDRYAISSFLRSQGLDPEAALVRQEGNGEGYFDETEICAKLEEPNLQMAILPSVIFTTGQLLNLEILCEAAHKRGVLLGLDLSHSIGVMPHALDKWGPDFAFWCHYKYVNAGPGAVAGLYLNRRHFDGHGTVTPGLAGWWGGDKNTMFEMRDSFTPARGAAALQMGTPHILSMAPLDGALTLLEEAGLESIRKKSLGLTRYMIGLLEATQGSLRLASPREDELRGGHIALRHPQARAICVVLRKRGVITDFRPPDLIRLAPSPLYNSYQDCFGAMRELTTIVESHGWEEFAGHEEMVT